MKHFTTLLFIFIFSSNYGFSQVHIDTFFFTGNTQIFTVNVCGTEVDYDVRAGKGGDRLTEVGGLGGRVQGTLTLSAGDVLKINVGGVGLDDQQTASGIFVGSGGVAPAPHSKFHASGTGGGASDIRLNGISLSDRIVVAGGGGGSGGQLGLLLQGGNGGGLTGVDGAAIPNFLNGGGKGGTQSSGGTAGIGGTFCTASSTAGGLGFGGTGSGDNSGGGGGGGGYYGGGGACFSGGGGGSSFTDSKSSKVIHVQGYQSGDGMIILSYNSGPNQTIIACDSLVSPSGKYTWKTSGVYKDTIKATPGCSDTALIIDLTVNNSYHINKDVTACSYYLWSVTGSVYKTSGIYSAVLTSINGCDSIITIDLTVVDPITIIDSVEVCDSYSWPVNGQTYSDNKKTSVTYTAANGCDSVRTLVLTIFKSDSLNDAITACGSYLWSQTGIEYTATGLYTASYTNILGCDSIHYLNLTINPIDASVSRPGKNILEANAASAKYQWLDCENNFAVLPADTNKTLIGEVGGNYAVMVTQNECIDTSDCISFYLGLEKNDFETEIKVYPNPTKGKMTIDLGKKYSLLEIEVYDIIGKIIFSKTVSNQDLIEVNIEGVSGEYFVKISNDNQKSAIIKILKL